MADIISNDIILENFDLEFLNGDLVVGNSNLQIASLLFESFTNDWKNSPLSGLNLIEYINSNISSSVISNLVSGLMSADGFNIQDLLVSYSNNELDIKTNALRNRL
jgi:hypothetical protein